MLLTYHFVRFIVCMNLLFWIMIESPQVYVYGNLLSFAKSRSYRLDFGYGILMRIWWKALTNPSTGWEGESNSDSDSDYDYGWL